MAWKIQSIEIENFKFFQKPFSLVPAGKHVLMYGENGSGKSSIYWAVYTLFQSSLKQSQEARKYFDSAHPDSLVNLYAGTNCRSGIKIEFVDAATNIKIEYEDSSSLVNTNVEGDNFIRLSTFSSDFMNYKFLSAIFDFKNSKPVDLFKIFEEEIFPFLSLDAARYDLDGKPTDETSVEQWWRYIKQCYESNYVLTRRANVYTHDEKWQAYQNLISDFNTRLQSLLTSIADEANKKLSDQNMPVKVALRLKKVEFDRKIPNSKRSYDGRFYPPQIILTAQLLHSDGTPISQKDIQHPRSFFNEAKLTRIALALRLAIFDRKYQADDCAKVIFVDDLLISLDMSNRLMVVQQLLNYADRYQLFVFTHDLAFYELIEDSIAQRNAQNDWCKFEMYAIDEEVDENYIPEPCLKEKKNFLQQARCYFSDYQYYAAANSLRKECEKQLLRLYPKHWTLSANSDGTVSMLNLNALDLKIKKFYARFGMENTLTPKIDQYRKRILNPASHNDSKAKVFRSELKMAIEEISQFEKINKLCISDENDIQNRVFSIDLAANDRHVLVEFTPLERWHKLEYLGQTYFEDIDVEIKRNDGFRTESQRSIRDLWRSICKIIGYSEDSFPPIESVITEKETHLILANIKASSKV